MSERVNFIAKELISAIGIGISIVGWIWCGVFMYLRCLNATIYVTNDKGMTSVIDKARENYDLPKAKNGEAFFFVVINPQEDANESNEELNGN